MSPKKLSMYSSLSSMALLFLLIFKMPIQGKQYDALHLQVYAFLAFLALMAGVFSLKKTNEYRNFSYIGIIISMILGIGGSILIMSDGFVGT